MNHNNKGVRRERDDVPVGTGPAGGAGVLEQQIDDERIARRAYAIYESRNRADGHSEADWLQAESEDRSRRTGAVTAADGAMASSSLADRVRSARR
jgi:hypothetical protein